MFEMTARGSGDSLTRTTLQIAGESSGALIGDVLRALKHVPGVLLADINPLKNRVIVAHDGAVPVTALLSAATAAGARATVVSDASPAATLPSAARRAPARAVSLIVAMVAVALALVCAQLLLPDTPPKHLIINALVIATWVCFFASVYVRRNR
jgi:hypothetical protein